jgi:hypothetical protein
VQVHFDTSLDVDSWVTLPFSHITICAILRSLGWGYEEDIRD